MNSHDSEFKEVQISEAICLSFESFVFWSWRKESNLQPSDYKSGALPLSYASHLSVLSRFTFLISNKGLIITQVRPVGLWSLKPRLGQALARLAYGGG